MIITRTPFRISFFGGGTDYPLWYEEHGGAVLSASIDKYCYITCRHLPPFFENRLRVAWSKIETVNNLDEIEHPSARESLRYMGIPHDIVIQHDADLPARSGMGSSSAFTVGLLHALHAHKGNMVSKYQLALDAIHVEQNCIKENVGSQDQPAAAFGGLNKITFGGNEKIQVQPVILSRERSEAFQDRLMLFFTGISRTASEVAGDWIKNTNKNEQDLHTMRKMVEEGITILNSPARNLDDFGRLLHESWLLKRGLATSISSSSIDGTYAAAREAGAIGGKLLGAGGGGFMLFFVPPEKQANVKEALKDLLHVPFRFEHGGSQVIYYGAQK